MPLGPPPPPWGNGMPVFTFLYEQVRSCAAAETVGIVDFVSLFFNSILLEPTTSFSVSLLHSLYFTVSTFHLYEQVRSCAAAETVGIVEDDKTNILGFEPLSHTAREHASPLYPLFLSPVDMP